jgi:16S rRNA (adenine1518-N6/adenine1519-N6)-dimethyltransferase
LLREEVPDWSGAADTLGFDRQVRAEALSLRQWIDLTNYVRPIVIPDGRSDGEESFPIVDARDRVVGSAPRSKVHGNNLRHRAVHVFIFNPLGEVLLQKRSRWKDRHPLVWDSSAAGHVEAGEDYDTTARRELQEELGIDISLKKLAEIPASDRTGQEFIWLYRGQKEDGFRLDRSEIEAARFFPPAVVTTWIAARPQDFAPGFVECWKAYLGRPDV